MSDDDRPGHGPDDETTAGTGGRGHLRDGHLRDGHLRDGHLRAGHLRGVRASAGGDLDGESVSVPDLLATDALLDRLGSHDTTEADLRDAVARLLDSYALHADPLTAGVRPVELPELTPVLEEQSAPVPGPRVLLASRRTLRRVGHGTAAAAAVLALLGGTAAAAATGAGSIAGRDGAVSTSVASQLPGWFPDTVFRAFGGTPEQRVEREVAQAKQEAQSGDSQAAIARMTNLARQIGASDDVDAALAATVNQTLTELQTPDSAAAPAGDPTTSPTPGPTGTTLSDVVKAASPTSSPTATPWVPTQSPGRPTTPAVGSDDPVAPSVPVVPVAPVTSAPAPVRGGGSTTTNPVVTPVVPPVTVGTQPPSGTVTTPPTTDSPTTTAPSDGPTTTGPSDTGTDQPTVTDTPTATDTTTPPTAAPTDSSTTPPSDPPATDGQTPVVTDPIVVVTPTLPVVVEPSPSTGAEPTPGPDDASGTVAAGS